MSGIFADIEKKPDKLSAPIELMYIRGAELVNKSTYVHKALTSDSGKYNVYEENKPDQGIESDGVGTESCQMGRSRRLLGGGDI